MISVKKAKQRIKQNIPPLKRETKQLNDILGFVLAQNIHAPFPLPLFDNSAMDGFALRSRDTRKARPGRPALLKIIGTVKAGDTLRQLPPRKTLRIMTGAMIPKGADTVLPKEEALLENGFLKICRPIPRLNHIRARGEETKKGSLVLREKSLIHPGTIAILASLGKERVKVFKKPTVALITSGSELVQPGQDLKGGKIYDSNSWMITAFLKTMGIYPAMVKTVKDNPRTLKKAVLDALEKSDVVILTGGVSVGEYDLVKEVLNKIGVGSIFWKVRQKPGKPIFFGRKKTKLIFGLPGNPAAVFTCFYEYVYPALKRMAGFKACVLTRTKAVLQKEVKADPQKLLFLKARISSDHGRPCALPLPHQGSHMIGSLQMANGLVLIEPQKGRLEKGREVPVDLLPYHQEVGS